MKIRAHLLWLRFLLAGFLVLLGANGSFAANFSLSLNSEAGDPVGKGVTKFFDQSNATIPNRYANPSLYFVVRSTGTSEPDWAVEFRCPADGALAVGTYEMASQKTSPRDLYQPFLYVRPFNTTVSTIRGQFEVKRMIYSATGGVSVWITFTQYANGSSAALTGEFKFEVDAELVRSNVSPKVYAGPDRTVELGRPIPFKAVVQDDGFPGGPVTVNWGRSPYSSGGSIDISSPDAAETTITFLVEGSFSLLVTASDGALSYSQYVNIHVQPPQDSNVLRFQLPVSLLGLPAGLNEFRSERYSFEGDLIDSQDVEIELDDRNNSYITAWEAIFALPNNLRPSPGIYPLGTNVPGAMTVKLGKGYNSYLPVVTGSVEIIEAQYKADGDPTLFHALFTLYTDTSLPPVLGEIRFRVDPDLVDAKPLVCAGLDRAFTTLESPILQGGVFLPAGTMSPTEVRWSKVSGPGDVVFTDAANPVTPVAFSAPGTYLLRLEVTDDSGTYSDEVQITDFGYESSIATKSLGRSNYYFPPNYQISGWVSTGTIFDSTLEFKATGVNSYSQTFTFRLPPSQTFAPGLYRTDTNPSNRTTITVPYGDNAEGYFEILELTRDEKGALASAWVKYKLTSSTGQGAEYRNVEGEIRFRTVAAESSVNRPPLVSAGPDLVTDARRMVLSAEIADDLLPYATPLQYSWKLLSGPSDVQLETPASHATIANFFEAGVYRFLFTVSDGEYTSSDELVVAVHSTKRSYEGLVRYKGAIVGRAVINLSAKYAFTARIQVGKSTLNLKGSLSDGSWSREMGNSFVSLCRSIEGDVVAGILRLGSDELEILARQTFGGFQRAVGVTCPHQGRHTLALLPPQGGAMTGVGYGDIVVQPSGAYRLKGTLADGVPFSAGGTLTIGGELELYLRLRKGSEQVVGSASFAVQGVEGLVGQLGWYRGVSRRPTMYPDGLNLGLFLRGSRYVAPTTGTTIFPPATSATATLSLFERSFPAILSSQLTFTGNQLQVTGAPAGFAVKFDAKTGYFKGSFKDPTNFALRRFGGVVLQAQKAGAGHFLREEDSGGVSLQMTE